VACDMTQSIIRSNEGAHKPATVTLAKGRRAVYNMI